LRANQSPVKSKRVLIIINLCGRLNFYTCGAVIEHQSIAIANLLPGEQHFIDDWAFLTQFSHQNIHLEQLLMKIL
jgi:hypothetical protein